jgi:hypothetical protein
MRLWSLMLVLGVAIGASAPPPGSAGPTIAGWRQCSGYDGKPEGQIDLEFTDFAQTWTFGVAHDDPRTYYVIVDHGVLVLEGDYVSSGHDLVLRDWGYAPLSYEGCYLKGAEPAQTHK